MIGGFIPSRLRMPDASPADTFQQAKDLFFAGLASLEAQRFEEAEQHFLAALARVPGRISTLVNLTATQILLGRPGDALASANTALAIEPDSPDATLHRATALAALARHSEALDAFDNLLSADESHAEAWSRQAQTLCALDRPFEALRSFERALAIAPTSPEFWSRYGELLRESGRLSEAATAFEKALAHGGDAELHGYLLASVGGATMPPRAPDRYVQALFDNYADDFDQHLIGVLGYQAHAVLTRHLVLLARGPFESALDLGCGTGLCGPLVKPHVRHLTGVDLSAAMIAKAGTLGVYSELVQGDLVAHLKATQRRYDLVLAADVFIYVGELDDVFSAVREATLPGAVFCFTAEIVPTSDTQCATVGGLQPSRGRGTGFAGPQAQWPPRGAGSDMQCATVGAIQLLPSLRYAHSEAYLRRLAVQHGFDVLDMLRQPVRQDQRQPIDGLYVYLVKA
jgi:predicted TPR repeat methyltransferase